MRTKFISLQTKTFSFTSIRPRAICKFIYRKHPYSEKNICESQTFDLTRKYNPKYNKTDENWQSRCSSVNSTVVKNESSSVKQSMKNKYYSK